MTELNRDGIREFLTTRRARVQPVEVGLAPGLNRRVPGLRRTEVALLAGMSVEYYSRLERGELSRASDAVLHGIAGALLLDDAERQHLFDLARAATTPPARRQRRSPRNAVVRPGLQLALDAVTGGPALVRNGRMDIIAANTLGRALHMDVYGSGERPVNLARHAFLDRERAELFYPDWDAAADAIVAILRTEAGRDPYDKDLQDLIGELSTRSEEFRRKWGDHNVRRHARGVKHFRHPIVGTLDLLFEASELMADPGWNLLIYTAEPGTPTADALRLLASWAATQDQEPAAPSPGGFAAPEGWADWRPGAAR
ncbi:helix-turn-helix domain-containing protein [Arthrobacter sp. 35W]|uniref:helix-turn-helix domain-containing protein n=1 Tax=Arthrobacter sp. 35W TaxID=1132441 RepID=UPI000553BE51|nr:helix-turn-helix transcriptional regulator [Arthrobacter sp. 35W]